MERESVTHDGTPAKLHSATSETNGERKTWVCMTASRPIQQSPGMNHLVDFVGGGFRNTCIRMIIILASWNPRSANFIQAELVAPMPPASILLNPPL
jgi:hypothetical protein